MSRQSQCHCLCPLVKQLNKFIWNFKLYMYIILVLFILKGEHLIKGESPG